MEHYICVTCGTQFGESEQPPDGCPICLDERQYVKPEGQKWTTLKRMKEQGSNNTFSENEPNLTGIATSPGFAIGQRALLVRTNEGNVLWDCLSYIDEETVKQINALGGLHAITASHPHFYGSMVEWAEYFNCPIYLPEADRQWVMRASDKITFWSGGALKLTEDVTIVRLGGHFAGSAVLHWSQGAGRKGALLTGDTIQVVADRRWVTFMYSYPNQIPLPAREVSRIAQEIEPYGFDRLYGGWSGSIVKEDAKTRVKQSAERYVQALK